MAARDDRAANRGSRHHRNGWFQCAGAPLRKLQLRLRHRLYLGQVVRPSSDCWSRRRVSLDSELLAALRLTSVTRGYRFGEMSWSVRMRSLFAHIRSGWSCAGCARNAGCPRHVAERIDVSNSKISRIETGRCVPPYEDVVGLLAIYGVTGAERRDLLSLARESKRTGWWQKSSVPLYERIHTLQTLEAAATSITNYEPEFIPGLLQTVPYMQAIMREVSKLSDDEMADRVAVRLRRQQVLRRRPEYTAIIAESVLHQGIGSAEVMHGQLTYLLEAAAKRYITIRVVPSSIGAHAGLLGPFVRLRFAYRADVVVETTRSSDIFLEDRDDLTYYDRAEPDVLAVALSEELSLKLIEGAARNRNQEANWHDLSGPDGLNLA